MTVTILKPKQFPQSHIVLQHSTLKSLQHVPKQAQKNITNAKTAINMLSTMANSRHHGVTSSSKLMQPITLTHKNLMAKQRPVQKLVSPKVKSVQIVAQPSRHKKKFPHLVTKVAQQSKKTLLQQPVQLLVLMILLCTAQCVMQKFLAQKSLKTQLDILLSRTFALVDMNIQSMKSSHWQKHLRRAIHSMAHIVSLVLSQMLMLSIRNIIVSQLLFPLTAQPKNSHCFAMA